MSVGEDGRKYEGAEGTVWERGGGRVSQRGRLRSAPGTVPVLIMEICGCVPLQRRGALQGDYA